MSALRGGFKVVVPPICLLSFALVSPAVGQHQEARGTVRCESNGPSPDARPMDRGAARAWCSSSPRRPAFRGRLGVSTGTPSG